MVGLILFTSAKVFVEIRATYAHSFKGLESQVASTYHVGVACGGLFAITLAVDYLQ